MYLHYVKAYLGDLLKSQFGAMLKSFARVAVAAAFAAWMSAGFPVTNLSGDDLTNYLELGVQAGAALVLANYFGPWETRYGPQAKLAETDD